jgi:hypothetical protein
MPSGRVPVPVRYPVAALAVLSMAFACGGDGPVDPPDPTPEPTTLSISAGDGQTATVGISLATSPAVVVRDQFGDPVSGVSVTWTPSDGTASPTTSATDGQGVATTTWTLGTGAGVQTMTAGAAGLSPVTFEATGEAGPVQSLTLAPDTVRFASLTTVETVTATAEDEYGNAAGGALTWVSRDEAVATVSAGGEVTAAGNGTTWVVAEAGAMRDSVWVEVSQAAAGIVVNPSADTINAIGDTLSLTATVLDTGGSPVDGVTIEFTSLEPGVATVDGAGDVTSASSGTAFIVASFGALADTAEILSRQVAAALTVAPDAEIGLDYGETLLILVSAQDSNGVDIPGSEATLTTDDPSVASLTGALLTAGSSEGETALTVELDGFQVTTNVAVSSGGFDRAWQGGHADSPADWGSPYNWLPAGSPGAADTLRVGPTPNDPVVPAADTVASLDVLSGATVDLAGHTLRLTNDVIAAGPVATGTLEMVGAAAAACGTVPSLLIVAASPGGPQPVLTLTCDLTVHGAVRSVGGRINDTGYTLKVQP